MSDAKMNFKGMMESWSSLDFAIKLLYLNFCLCDEIQKAIKLKILSYIFTLIINTDLPQAIAMLKHQFSFNNRSQGTLGLVATWVGDPNQSAAGAVAGLSLANAAL